MTFLSIPAGEAPTTFPALRSRLEGPDAAHDRNVAMAGPPFIRGPTDLVTDFVVRTRGPTEARYP